MNIWNNEFSCLLGVKYPVIQAPMLGVTTPEMVAAANKAGTLGSLALGDLPAGKCIELIRATRTITANKFAVNIFVNKIPEITPELRLKYDRVKSLIEEIAKQEKVDVDLPSIDSLKLTNYQDQIDVIIAEKCKIVSFTFGNLNAESIKKLKENDTILIGTCTSVEEALVLDESGIDIICVQGIEAGGHRGSFIGEDIPQIGGLSLLAQVRDVVARPLIYAGGLYNANTIMAARALGAQGYQVGSILLGSQESVLMHFEKQRLRTAKQSDIVLTRSFTGRYARGIKNKFIELLGRTNDQLPYPYQNKLTAELRKKSKEAANPDFVSIWAGQSLNGFSSLSTTDILNDLIANVENMYSRFYNGNM